MGRAVWYVYSIRPVNQPAMRCASILSLSVQSSETIAVRIEVDIQPGLPHFTIIGLPDRQIDEAKERVRSAIRNCGVKIPLGAITVNLSPSHVSKRGTGFDLGIALGIMQACGAIPPIPTTWAVLGELTLAGSIISHSHAVAALSATTQCIIEGCIISTEDVEAARLVEACPIAAYSDLPSLLRDIRGGAVRFSKPDPIREVSPDKSRFLLDDIIGCDAAKRAVAIALSGGHHLFLEGPPGVGKTLLAQAASELLPPLNKEHRIELARLYALRGEQYGYKETAPPLRNPHHTASVSAMVGGGNSLLPGELSLAHHGILFLDELPLFASACREVLRKPLEERYVSLSKRQRVVTYPCSVIAIACRNRCPCGNAGVPGKKCICSQADVLRYSRLISGPLLDRFDMHVSIDNVEYSLSPAHAKGYSGAEMAKKIAVARKSQHQVFNDTESLCGTVAFSVVKSHVTFDEGAEHWLRTVSRKVRLSHRAMQSVVRVAATIGVFDYQELRITMTGLHEAFHYRSRGDA